MAENKVAEAFIEIGAKLDKLGKQLKEAEKMAKASEAEVDVTADISKAEAGVADAVQKAEESDAEMAVEADTEKAETEFERVAREIRATDIKVDVTADTGEAESEINRVENFVEQSDPIMALHADTTAAEREVDQAAQRIESRMEKSGEASGVAFATALAKGFAALAFVESSAKLATAAVRGFKGDIEGLDQALTSLPFGVGPAIAAVRDFGHELNGTAEEGRKLEAQAKAVARQIEVIDANLSALERIEDLDFSLAVAGLEGLDRKLAEIERDRVTSVRSIVESMRAEGVNEAIIRQATERINQLARMQESLARADEQSRRVEQNNAFLESAAGDLGSLEQQATLAEIEDPFEREREAARQQLAAMQARAQEVGQADKLLAERLSEQSDRIHQARLRDIDKREAEAAQRERDARVAEAQKTAEAEARERESIEDRLASQFDRLEAEARRQDETIEKSGFRVGAGSRTIADAASSIRGGGSLEQFAKDTRPQEIKSKTLEEIKGILSRIEEKSEVFG